MRPASYFAATLKRIVDIETANTRGVSPHLLTVLAGQARSNRRCATSMSRGRIGADPGHAGQYTRDRERVRLTLITGFIPDLPHDIITPMRAIGCTDEQIAQLGGDLARSDLQVLLG